MDENLKKEQINPYVLIDETDKDAILNMESETAIDETQYLHKDVYLGKIKLSNEPEIAVTNKVFDRIEDKTPFLGNYTVQEVQEIIDEGEAENYWSVGDITDLIELNGTVGTYTFDHESYRAMIIGFNHNAKLETNGCYSMTLQFGQNEDGINIAFADSSYSSTGTSDAFRMNTSNTNSGGWESSYMRNTICPEFLEVLPNSLQNVIGTTTKYTDNVGNDTGSVESNISATEDKIFLLGSEEVFNGSYANTYEADYTERYAWYTENDSNSMRIRYRHSSSSAASSWWLRSPCRIDSSTFCYVNTSGNSNASHAGYSWGFASAFNLISNNTIIETATITLKVEESRSLSKGDGSAYEYQISFYDSNKNIIDINTTIKVDREKISVTHGVSDSFFITPDGEERLIEIPIVVEGGYYDITELGSGADSVNVSVNGIYIAQTSITTATTGILSLSTETEDSIVFTNAYR